MKLCLYCEGPQHMNDPCPLAPGRPAFDPVNKPIGYTKRTVAQPGEVIDVLEAWDLPHHLACTIKYIARHRDKGTPLQDLEKARWYLDRWIARLKT